MCFVIETAVCLMAVDVGLFYTHMKQFFECQKILLQTKWTILTHHNKHLLNVIKLIAGNIAHVQTFNAFVLLREVCISLKQLKRCVTLTLQPIFATTFSMFFIWKPRFFFTSKWPKPCLLWTLNMHKYISALISTSCMQHTKVDGLQITASICP